MKKLIPLLLFIIILSCKTTHIQDDNKSEPNNPSYPRFAMWWPNSWDQDVSDLSRYDYIGWGNWENEDTLKAIKEINSNQLHFTAISITETCWSDWKDEKELMNQIPDVWFLTQVGSYLSTPITKNQTIIKVNQTQDNNSNPLFEAGDILALGFESMKLISVKHKSKTLIVERGFIRGAEHHNSGDRIAAHISFWPETWVMNLSTLCPKYDTDYGSETWVDWALRHYIQALWPFRRDGFIIDRVEKSQSWLVSEGEYGRNIDPDCSNTFITDNYKVFDSAWYLGIRAFLPKIREMLNGKPLFGNTFGAYNDLLNGSIWESCPGNWSDSIPEVFNDWAERILGRNGYIEVSKKGYFPNFSFVETYELEEYLNDPEKNNPLNDPDFKPNYQRMRFGLTTALLGNGYFSYEINTNGHGSLGLMWFDEYDNAGKGKGYLGYPEDNAYVILDLNKDGKIFRRDFDNGIVICNPSEKKVYIDLGDIFKLIEGTQVPDINNGERVSKITIQPRDGRILLKIN